MTEEDVDYILSAISFVADYGWMFLPHYQFEPETGCWVNRNEKEVRVRSWLGKIDYSNGMMDYSDDDAAFIKRPPTDKAPLSDYLSIAEDTLVRVVSDYKNLYGKSEMD